jgi:hypothetical protein
MLDHVSLPEAFCDGQKVTVEHVHVHSGGQAVVGLVGTPGDGDRTELEDQPHAKQIAHAPELTLWSTDAERESVPIAGNAEWPLSVARRLVAGSAEGEQERVEARALYV